MAEEHLLQLGEQDEHFSFELANPYEHTHAPSNKLNPA